MFGLRELKLDIAEIINHKNKLVYKNAALNCHTHQSLKLAIKRRLSHFVKFSYSYT